MKTETPATPDRQRSFAFTLIELLVVIAIIAILAALFLSLGGSASRKKKIARVKVELIQITTMIDSYREKLGYYPPDNPNNPALNTLFYELSGTTSNGTDHATLNGSASIKSTDIPLVFGVASFVNSASVLDASEARDFSKGLRLSQFRGITNPANAQVLSVPVDGALPGINTWRYRSSNPTYNPNGYDLWAEIVISGETHIIGNWKH